MSLVSTKHQEKMAGQYGIITYPKNKSSQNSPQPGEVYGVIITYPKNKSSQNAYRPF